MVGLQKAPKQAGCATVVHTKTDNRGLTMLVMQRARGALRLLNHVRTSLSRYARRTIEVGRIVALNGRRMIDHWALITKSLAVVKVAEQKVRRMLSQVLV
ncbi:unnamed protein product [Nippostrongylus brasiliensis]|uniref:Transposase n=1 Tax=Nippostrongylus brasiliensis TaxID=27835 RepID=A0A0N4YYI1_NIPBR|nr:unnamed protein product [Nippostrongylus brasiliensis]